jgi:tripartite-type tricarboxylate transporter receptor subunit TctC
MMLVLAIGASRAQDYPDRAVKFVVPAAAGSTTDMLARLVADELGRRWGKPTLVENIAGGGMNIGADYVARAEPNGYTLMVSPPSPVTINHLMYKELSYDPRQFVPVALLAKIPNVLAVRTSFPASSVRELIAYAKANPEKVTFASQGMGSTAHLSASQMEVLGGVKMVHVPYRGAQPALNDVVAGHVDLFFDTLVTSVPLYRGDKLKLLGVASPERVSALPEIPTIAESGLPGFRSVTWFALIAPPGTPADLVERINREVTDIFKRPDIVAKLQTVMLEPLPGTPADAARFFADETQLWGRVIKESHLTPQ